MKRSRALIVEQPGKEDQVKVKTRLNQSSRANDLNMNSGFTFCRLLHHIMLMNFAHIHSYDTYTMVQRSFGTGPQ